MRRHAVMICGALLLTATTILAATTEEQLKQLEQRSAKAVDTGLEEYAKDRFDSARASIAAAKTAAAIGRDKESLQLSELAEARLNAAEAKAAEKEMLEKVAVRRSELKKSEYLLERYRQGEVN